MKALNKVLNIWVIILSLLIAKTYSLSCYECTNCGNNVGTLVQCSIYDTYCTVRILIIIFIFVVILIIFSKKIVASASFVSSVTRKCTPACLEIYTSTFLGSGGGSFCCKVDGCNFATKSISNIFLASFSTILSIVFTFYKL